MTTRPRYILEELATWFPICGEAIYGTRPWRVFGEGDTRVTIDGFTENKTEWNSSDYRFTQKDGALYAFLMKAPRKRRGGAQVPGPQREGGLCGAAGRRPCGVRPELRRAHRAAAGAASHPVHQLPEKSSSRNQAAQNSKKGRNPRRESLPFSFWLQLLAAFHSPPGASPRRRTPNRPPTGMP